MKAVSDASSLLSLGYLGVLDDVLGIMDVYTTSSVEDELKEMAGFRDEKSVISRNILDQIQKGSMKCFDFKGETGSKHASMNHILHLCISARIPVLLTDDPDTAYFLGRMSAQKGIKIRMCTAVLVELMRAGRINSQAARNRMGELIKKRSWEGGILEVLVKRYMEENVCED